MMPSIVLSTTTYFLIIASLVALMIAIVDHGRSKKKRTIRGISETGSAIGEIQKDQFVDPPGPKPWPIIGSLDILGQYDIAYKAFAVLAKTYNSQIIKLRLGSLNCVVVNGLENIKEVLVTKGTHFDSRPNFVRYHQLFAGNKENSLAFSDWSDVQKSRRETLRAHTFPRAFTTKYNQLNSIISNELESFLGHLDRSTSCGGVDAKQLVLFTCANIFTSYFCSKKFDFEDIPFRRMIDQFDKIFWEVNQGYAADFMPFLMPLHALNMHTMAKWSRKIREFVSDTIIGERTASWTEIIPEEDYVDCLINHVQTNSEPKITWETAMFALEDILGGHSAIGNFLIKVFAFLVTRRNVQELAQREIDSVEGIGRIVGLEQRRNMPYTEAILLEAIRLISSPIVPHVANRDSSLAGYKVNKDTFLFLNNYDLNMSEHLWTSPEDFKPERFIKNGCISKPEHFLPFGGGRRSCMGYKMVQYLSFSTVASVLKNYTILPVDGEIYNIRIGTLALPEKPFNFKFERR